MKKHISFLICMMLLLTMAAPVRAEDTVTPPDDLNTVQEGDNPQDGSGEDDPDDSKDDGEKQEDPHEHNWTVTDTATCTQAGTITKTCGCGASESSESPAKGHQWDNGNITTEANCMQAGVKKYTCSVCREKKTEELTRETTHDYGSWTKTAAGHVRACDDCLVEDSGAHDWKEEIVKKPSCKEDGSKKKSCTVCDYSESIVLPKLTTHTYDSACDEECNVCGLTREIEHTFTKVWSKSYKGHWHECTKCGEQADFAKHIPGPAATEDKEQVCLTCSYVIMPKKAHVHSYGSEWTSDDTGHWHACTGCKEEKDYASHTFDDDCDPDCNTCGHKRENSHSYDTEGWLTSSFEHWNICSVCGEESKHEKHIPGEEATDEAPQICTVCKYELAPMLEHIHDFGTTWIQAQDSHWQECKCGELSVPMAHVWDEGRENRNDTITYTCVDCGAEKMEESKSSGFPWLIVILVLLALVCLGGIAALVIILKRGGFEDESDDDAEYEENSVDADDYTDTDDEEKMIDDYFDNLDQELYK